jgi:hypothetical protein
MAAKTLAALIDKLMPRRRAMEAPRNVCRVICDSCSGERRVFDDKHSTHGDCLEVFIFIPGSWER